jgi:hypothetical protein
LNIAHLQLGQAQLVGQARHVAAARERVPVVVHCVFRKAPGAQNVGLHLQRLRRRGGRVRQVRLNLRPLLRLVHALSCRRSHGLVLRDDPRRTPRNREQAQQSQRAGAGKLRSCS